ncbi:histidine kinase [Selenomonas sp. oral taxon 138]|uniref:sensor histidine kinase n=1 Tax=Selenomonas sp. oral taxon 138 TaxID=712532 RepID=UPI0002A3605E|nr:histidine kinase [Selenomonas sp. oral taxon 138]EKY01694.1 ATPase/histidine kinase/DNA gyrase B/HSP90 domain protein [Selenomonas sp. oral taxon 138 str. F0429]
MRRFQDEVRSELLKYALLPGLLIAFICTALAALYWEQNVVTRTAEEARTAGEIFTELTHDYEARAGAIALHGIGQLHADGEERRIFFENLYAELNLHGALPEFYLLGSERQVLFQTRAHLPDYLAQPTSDWGVLARMDAAEGCVQEFVPQRDRDWDYVVGQAIRRPQTGDTEGYAVFVMPAQELAKRLQTGEKMHVVIADRAGRAPFSTMTIFRDPVFHKIVSEIADAQGLVEVDGQQFYVMQEPVLDGSFTVYAILPVGSRIAQVATGAGILFAVLLLMIPFIFFRVRREMAEKMCAMDEIIDAFRAVRHGHLDRELVIRTGNEFEEIAGEYNRMVQSLVQLMEENEEKARVSVISEVRQLESQFNPHFLFNTLENIKFMTKLDPDAAMRMITALSALLRYSIDSRVQRVPLAEDICHLGSYVEIQRQRFGARLCYRQEVAEEAEACLVPKLLLQPIVENAIHYGADAEGVIDITTQISVVDGCLHIVIADRGTGMDEETLYRLREMMERGENRTVHTGIYNIHRRIQLLYGTAYGMEIARRAGGGTRVTMVLPADGGKGAK